MASTPSMPRYAIADVTYKLVLLGRKLPGADKISLIPHVRASIPGVAIIVLSAITDVSARVQGLDAGADDCLAKPFSLDVPAAPTPLKQVIVNLTKNGTQHGGEAVLVTVNVFADTTCVVLQVIDDWRGITHSFRDQTQLRSHGAGIRMRIPWLHSIRV